ncbi:MAG: right-handed parallel beta-helix repeat-containing protein [bacterium]
MQTALSQARTHVWSTGGLAILYFPTGIYYLTATIQLIQNDSNIVFQGAGSDRTILEFQYMKDNTCFNLSGTVGAWSDLNQNFNKEDSVFHTPTGGLSGINAGSWIHFIKNNFDYNTPNPPLEPEIVGQITRLEAKGTDGSGDWGEIKDVANMNYVDSSDPNYSLKTRKVTPVQNIGLENLTINRYPSQQATAIVYNISFDVTVNCWVKGVESYKTSRHHFNINRSSHIKVSGCYFHEAMNYGNGGWGYGVVTYASSTNCLIENNIFRKLRHAMVAGGGSNCNVWEFNYSCEQTSSGAPPTYRDLDLHAKYPFGHLFEHNFIETMGSDDTHGDNGRYNAFVRNFSYDGNADFQNMEYWSTLGNIRSTSPFKALFHFFDTPAVTDRFGFWDSYTVYRTHNVAYQRSDGDVAELLDVSYFYSQRPSFLPLNYTWPAIGPKISATVISQNIPGKDRFNSSKKTYLTDPTPKPLTTSGTLPYDQTWPNGHTLTGNVLVPDNTFILVENGSTINLNGYHIASLGSGEIIRQGSTTFSPFDIRVKSGAKIVGQFSTITYALTTSQPGQVVELAPATYTFNNNLTIASGKNLSLLAGAMFNFTGNYKLRVEGTLIANGTSSNKITFTRSGGTWYGIELYNASSCQISYSNIYNAQYGLRAINSSPILTWSTVKYNTVGVRFENNSVSYGGALQGNVIAENSSDGIQCYQYSDPALNPSNVIRYNNFYGVYGDATAVPSLGLSYPTGYNSVYYNTFEVWSVYPGTIYARYHWWGDANPTPNVSGNVDWSNYLDYDPNSGLGKSLAENPPTKNSENQIEGESEADTLGMAEVDLAYKIFLGGEYEEALSRFEAIVGKYPDNFSSRRALIFVTRSLNRLNRQNESLARVAQLVQNFTGKEVFGLAQSFAVGELVKSGQYAEAVARSQEIVNNFPGTALAKYALYDLGSIHWYRLEDEKTGETYFRRLIAEWPEDDLAISALATLGEWKPGPGKGNQPASAPLQSIPRNYGLAQNYPNPFNPQTEILYQVPEASHIILKIYDLLGKEVRTLVDKYHEAGYHRVLWDGRDHAGHKIASSVYIYRLLAEPSAARPEGYVLSKKMMLVQ